MEPTVDIGLVIFVASIFVPLFGYVCYREGFRERSSPEKTAAFLWLEAERNVLLELLQEVFEGPPSETIYDTRWLNKCTAVLAAHERNTIQ